MLHDILSLSSQYPASVIPTMTVPHLPNLLQESKLPGGWRCSSGHARSPGVQYPAQPNTPKKSYLHNISALTNLFCENRLSREAHQVRFSINLKMITQGTGDTAQGALHVRIPGLDRQHPLPPRKVITQNCVKKYNDNYL